MTWSLAILLILAAFVTGLSIGGVVTVMILKHMILGDEDEFDEVHPDQQ